MKYCVRLILAICVICVGACIESRPLLNIDAFPEEGTTASQTIGKAGGALTVGHASFVFPENAFQEDTVVQVTVEKTNFPQNFSNFSSVYKVEVQGEKRELQHSIAVKLPFKGSENTATVFRTATPESLTLVALPTTINGVMAASKMNTLGRVFVGTACSGENCCDQANGKLDLLMVIDNSNSMKEEQEQLRTQIEYMTRILSTGDSDNDGIQDFPVPTSLHVGVISNDMGSGGYPVDGCDDFMRGDNAELLHQGILENCSTDYPIYAELNAGADEATINQFVEHVNCVTAAAIDNTGCGYEQPLEATARALTTQAESGGANFGFLRDDSVLAILTISDEDDCSAKNWELYDPHNASYGDIHLRCALDTNSDLLYPPFRYIDGLKSLRSNPANVIYALVSGIPIEFNDTINETDFQTILDHPDMAINVIDKNLSPACSSQTGLAYPARRLVQVAQGFGTNGLVQSICDDNYQNIIDGILYRLSLRSRGICF